MAFNLSGVSFIVVNTMSIPDCGVIHKQTDIGGGMLALRQLSTHSELRYV
jgi:hypothetical protein